MKKIKISLLEKFWNKLVMKYSRKIKFTYQIWTRGWCDADTWSLDSTLAEIILPRIKILQELKSCYPCNLTEEEWNSILNKIIRAFEICQDDVWESKSEAAEIEEGLQLFVKYYRNLWW
jgi:hypothetical protein